MGKIVKYCAACDESFAEKFGFCPNCGQEMTAFEMSPVAAENNFAEAASVDEANKIAERFADTGNDVAGEDETLEVPATAPIIAATVPSDEIPAAVEPNDFPVEAQSSTAIADDSEIEGEDITPVIPEYNAPETKSFAAAAGAGGNDATNSNQYSNLDANNGFRVTVIEEKNVKQRNLLLLGSLLFMTTVALGGLIYNLFTLDLGVGAIDAGNPLYVSVIDDAPAEIEQQPKKEKEKGGGGGGGGDENSQEATKGRLANQVDKPIMPPKPLPQVTNPELANPEETQGKNKRERTTEPVGLPNGLQSDNLSSGRGRGGGIGNGNGTGIGNGNGTGEGNGNGSGSGNGEGDGNGNGRGGGGTRVPPPPPTAPVGVTEKYKILAKPRADYTDTARQNSIQGTVIVKVTLLASGQIGNVTAVSGLPYGLTEKAIAAARGIKFEPTKKNGVPQTTIATIQYSFSIY